MIPIPQNLEPTDIDLLSVLLPEFVNSATIGPRFRDMNWETEFRKDMVIKKGFVVSQPPFKKRTKERGKNSSNKRRSLKNPYGIHSLRFGSDWKDDRAFAERYSCECGETIGRIFEGKRCPYCGKKVKFVDTDLKMFAWLSVENPDYCVIHPLLYRKLDSFFGKNTLATIINFRMDMTLDGEFCLRKDIDYKKYPYYGIGMLAFKEKFDEIMLYYLKKKKDKKPLYDHIMQNKDKIFTTKIPVYSAVLRQVFFSEEDYKYTKIDRCYNAIYGNFCRLNEEVDGVNHRNFDKINKNLFRAQKNLNEAYEIIFNELTEKEGLIRTKILGGRINFAARTVIVPNYRLRSYQIELPYVCFVELYKEQIINLLVKLDGCSYTEAVAQWFDGYRDFDPKIYKVIQYILKHTKHGCKTLLNRNPTMKLGSFIAMDIAHVKEDYDDLSAGLPIACLSSLNADFDGDVTNTIELISEELKKAYAKKLSPKTSFLISANDGYLNEDFGLIKDQQIALYNWCTV